MIVNANPRTDSILCADAIPEDRFVQQIAAVCATHDVACGSPKSMADFMHALDENKLLAMNFWSVVARFSDGLGSNALISQLKTIVESVTGRSVAEMRSSGPEQNVLVSRLASMLAGEDVQRPASWSLTDFDRELDSVVPERTAAESGAANPPAPLDRKPAIAAANNPDPSPRPATPLAGHVAAGTDGLVSAAVAVGLLLAVAAGGGLLFGRQHPAPEQPAALVQSIGHMPAITPSDDAAHRASSGPLSIDLAATANSFSIATSQASTKKNLPKQIAAQNPPIPPAPNTRDHPAATGPGEPAATENMGATEAASTFVVAGESMQNHLISSRAPVLPETAKAAHAGSRVVLHATITARGTVEGLWIVAGDPTLRQAAIDAASNWQYQPYLVSGKPVNVSTTISVVFPVDNP